MTQVAAALAELGVVTDEVALATDATPRVDARARVDRPTVARCGCGSTAVTRPTRSWWPRRGGSSPTRTRAHASRSPDCSRSSTKRCASTPRTTPGCTSRRSSPPASPGRRPRSSRSINPTRPPSPTSPTARRSTRPSPRCGPTSRRLRDARVTHGALDGEHVLRRRRGIDDRRLRPRFDLRDAGAVSTWTWPRPWSRRRCARRSEHAVDVAAGALTVDELLAAQRYLTKPGAHPGHAPRAPQRQRASSTSSRPRSRRARAVSSSARSSCDG